MITSIMFVRVFRCAVNGADPCLFLASMPKRRYQQWTATQHSITKWCPVVPLAVLWLLASPSPPGGSLERVIEFLFVWFLSWVSRGYLLPMTCHPRHVSLWISPSYIINHAEILFVLFNIQILVWCMPTDASCWSLSVLYVFSAIFQHLQPQLLFQPLSSSSRTKHNSMRALSQNNLSQSHFKMSHGALSLVIWIKIIGPFFRTDNRI